MGYGLSLECLDFEYIKRNLVWIGQFGEKDLANIQSGVHKKFEGVVDIFDSRLNEMEAEQYDFGYVEHNLKYEQRYLDLFQSLFHLNDSQLIVRFEYKSVATYELLNIIDGLDIKEKHVLLHLMQYNYLSVKGSYFKIEDLNQVFLFAKIMTRELYTQVEIYFENIGVGILGGFDLSLPVIVRDEMALEVLRTWVSKHNLHVR